jgi:isopentenyl diphosphate isomerase/L-lactate dehydrogenase-like FMN-dependent dehydrogenase
MLGVSHTRRHQSISSPAQGRHNISRIERMLASSRVVNVEDMRLLAERRVPKIVFDYIDGGADAEVTLRENCRVFQDVTFRPRQAVSFGDCDLGTVVLGSPITVPALLGPVGYSRVMHPGGEVAAARAAGRAGTGYVLSTISGHRLESVREASTGPAWYQLYLIGGREVAESAIDRARRAGFDALVITVDTAVAGNRERDLRNGMKELFSGSAVAKLPYLPQFLSRPGWLLRFLLDGGVPDLANVTDAGQASMRLIDVAVALKRAVVSWNDLRWIRTNWPGPIVVKGVLTKDDAHRAADEGAAAIVVSNHGGRQLDGVSPSLTALPSIAESVGAQVEVLIDGGFRRGEDIIKALCMGARAVLLGRAYAYGLAAAGEAGVARILEILRADVERTMRLLGCHSLSQLDSSFVDYPASWNDA